MDFKLTAAQETLRDRARELGVELSCQAAEGSLDLRAAWKTLARLRVQGLPFSRQYGGGGEELPALVAALEGLGYGCRDSGLLFALSAQMLSVQAPIEVFGTDEQKQRFLQPLNQGLLIGAHAMSEAGSGSDAFGLSTTARRAGDHYVLNGAKSFTTNAPVADLFIVFATVDKNDGFMGVTAFLIEQDAPGLSISPNWSKLGLHSAPMGQVFLNDCEVPADQRLGGEGAGFRIFNESMDWERGLILSHYLGAMQRQVEDCVEVVQAEYNAGDYNRFRAREAIARMKTRLAVARLLVYRVAWAKQAGAGSASDAAMAKLLASESWLHNCEEALPLLRGASRAQAEQDLLDSLGAVTYSGTSEIQRNLIAQSLSRA